MKGSKIFLALLISFMFLAVLGPNAHAATELRYSSPYAPTHPYSIADQKWFDKIEADTKGNLKIKPYWNSTLISGRESMRELASGVADIAFVTPIYEKSGVDLTKAILDFFADSNPEINAKIYWQLYNKFPEIRKEYEKLKILAVNVGIPMFLMTTKNPIKSIGELKGLRIRITGNAMMRTMKALGAEPVGMPVVEMLESLQKGIIGGVIFAHGDYKSLKLAETVKYETENFVQDRGIYVSRCMNKNSWDKLPRNIQKIIDASKDWWSDTIFNEQKKPEADGKEMAVKAGVQFVRMDTASLKKYSNTLDAENRKEAEALDARGFPGTKVYKEARRLVKLYNKK
ncbi:MAG: TRAP transporter substrate-binding protein DctP [Spirochaetes bacterium]|nr:TRAP transporter substrate-binding protein DctP [Spirochaetota bacterium]